MMVTFTGVIYYPSPGSGKQEMLFTNGFKGRVDEKLFTAYRLLLTVH
jgi:hypothetical protein